MRKSFNDYYPLSIDDMVMTHATKGILKDMIDDHSIDNILLHGAPATGKSSLARLFSKNYWLISCDHYETGIETVIEIQRMSTSTTLFNEGDRIIILDNIDCLEERFQKKLANVIDQTPPTTSYIATTTNLRRVIPALRSLLIQICLNFDPQNSTIKSLWEQRLTDIYSKLKNEKPTTELINYAMKFYPDARQMIYAIQYGSLD